MVFGFCDLGTLADIFNQVDFLVVRAAVSMLLVVVVVRFVLWSWRQ